MARVNFTAAFLLPLKVANFDLASAVANKTGAAGAMEVEVWRVGPLQDWAGRGIHFGSTASDAKHYSFLHKDAEPSLYHIKAQNVYVTQGQGSLCRELLNKSWGDEVVRVDLAKFKGGNSPAAARTIEAKMAQILKKQGFDALAYTAPQLPAKMEFVVLNPKSATITLVEEPAAKQAARGGSLPQGQLRGTHLPAQTTSAIVSAELENYRVNQTTIPVGEQPSHEGSAPWQQYYDYPLAEKRLTYDPERDPGLMNNPDRRVPQKAPESNSRGTLARLKNPLFKHALFENENVSFTPYEKLCSVCNGTRKVNGQTCNACSGTGTKIVYDWDKPWHNKSSKADDRYEFECPDCEHSTHEFDIATRHKERLTHGEPNQVVWEDRRRTAGVPDTDKELLLQHFQHMEPEEIATEVAELFQNSSNLHQWVRTWVQQEGHTAAKDSGRYGVRWKEFDDKDRLVTKERFFESEELRTGFIKKLETKNNFKEVVSKTGAAPLRWILEAMQQGNELVRAKGFSNGILKNNENWQRAIPEALLNKLIAEGTIKLKEVDSKGHEHYVLAPDSKQASKAANPRVLMVPEKDQVSVAAALAKSGLLDFEVAAADGLAHFSFPSPQERNVAAEIISCAFADQIAARKGFWGYWTVNEDQTEFDPSHEKRPTHLYSSELGLDSEFLTK